MLVWSCNVGLGSVAQHIANETGCTVYSPIGYHKYNKKNLRDGKIATMGSKWTYPMFTRAKCELKKFTPGDEPIEHDLSTVPGTESNSPINPGGPHLKPKTDVDGD